MDNGKTINEPSSDRFRWTTFYENVADQLLKHQQDRTELINGIHAIRERVPIVPNFQDRFKDGDTGPLQDICPFTVLGIFNRQITKENRILLAEELAHLLNVDVPVPELFEGIPVLNNLNSWFFGWAHKRGENDIDTLWNVFATAKRFKESYRLDLREQFVAAYDAAMDARNVKWNLSFGLYWANPWNFLPMDSKSREYVEQQLNIAKLGPQPPNAEDYLELIDEIKARFGDESFPVESFPDLSLKAWKWKQPFQKSVKQLDQQDLDTDDDTDLLEGEQDDSPGEPYSVEKIIEEGSFLERDDVERIVNGLRENKNVILQGPPGTGKTWIAKRLAYVLMGEKSDERIRAIQFHPNLTYEDFVRGYRPSGDGRLTVSEGVFMKAIHDAIENPNSIFAVVIEEINRGNPAQIFGELLTLLEADKRTPSEALELSYPDENGMRKPVHIPENLYVIGTMNIADRSLAIVDFAFRRRFAFFSLKPEIGERWRSWVTKQGGVAPDLVQRIEQRINALNEVIAEELGKQFCIGHSYLMPANRLEPQETRDWFIQVVETKIEPLLEEYWFDSPSTATKEVKKLTEGW